MQKARQLVAHNKTFQQVSTNPDIYMVPSSNNHDKQYYVSSTSCECAYYMWYGRTCKHMKAVAIFLAQNTQLEERRAISLLETVRQQLDIEAPDADNNNANTQPLENEHSNDDTSPEVGSAEDTSEELTSEEDASEEDALQEHILKQPTPQEDVYMPTFVPPIYSSPTEPTDANNNGTLHLVWEYSDDEISDEEKIFTNTRPASKVPISDDTPPSSTSVSPSSTNPPPKVPPSIAPVMDNTSSSSSSVLQSSTNPPSKTNNVLSDASIKSTGVPPRTPPARKEYFKQHGKRGAKKKPAIPEEFATYIDQQCKKRRVDSTNSDSSMIGPTSSSNKEKISASKTKKSSNSSSKKAKTHSTSKVQSPTSSPTKSTKGKKSASTDSPTSNLVFTSKFKKGSTSSDSQKPTSTSKSNKSSTYIQMTEALTCGSTPNKLNSSFVSSPQSVTTNAAMLTSKRIRRPTPRFEDEYY
jgi:hypothetical protein